MVVEVEAEDGTCGVGVTIGGEAGCYIVEHHLSRFCEGQDPRNIELMWDPNLSWDMAVMFCHMTLPVCFSKDGMPRFGGPPLVPHLCCHSEVTQLSSVSAHKVVVSLACSKRLRIRFLQEVSPYLRCSNPIQENHSVAVARIGNNRILFISLSTRLFPPGISGLGSNPVQIWTHFWGPNVPRNGQLWSQGSSHPSDKCGWLGSLGLAGKVAPGTRLHAAGRLGLKMVVPFEVSYQPRILLTPQAVKNGPSIS